MPARIVFRRPIKLPGGNTHFSAGDFNKTFEITAPACETEKRTVDVSQQFAALMRQLYALAQWRYSGGDQPPLPIKQNPDDPQPPLQANETEITIETRCENEDLPKR